VHLDFVVEGKGDVCPDMTGFFCLVIETDGREKVAQLHDSLLFALVAIH
jgi:hypothetical protein